MCNNTDYRYAKSKGDREKKSNLHLREMIEMLKNEEVKDDLKAKTVKLSSHSFLRMRELFKCRDMDSATKVARGMLKHAVRIGTVLAYDGRINVLYAYQKTAFFLSPDLTTLVTVNKYPDVTYRQFLDKIQGLNREQAIAIHVDFIREIEVQEQEYRKKILSIEQRVKDTTEQVAGLLNLVRGTRRQGMRDVITEMNNQLKEEGRKLFNLKVEKRHVCKSLVALY